MRGRVNVQVAAGDGALHPVPQDRIVADVLNPPQKPPQSLAAVLVVAEVDNQPVPLFPC